MMFWRRKKVTEDEVAQLMAESIRAERDLEFIKGLLKPRDALELAKHEIALAKAEKRAKYARWAAHDAGVEAGIIDEFCW